MSYPERVGLLGLDPAASFLDDFDTHFAPRLGIRAASYRIIFEALLADSQGDVSIVETGCLRVPGNWAGDGQSTFLFDHLTSKIGGRVTTIDLSPEAAEAARAVVSPRVEVIAADGTATLANLQGPIDLLYLDSMDVDLDNPGPAALNHLFELAAAMRALRPGAIVAVDDCMIAHRGGHAGKGVLVAPFFNRIGARMIADGYLAAWRMPF